MTFAERACSVLLTIALYGHCAKAQDAPIGYWSSHLPYNSALGVAADGATVYTICNQAFFSTGGADGTVTFSKTDGMSDIGMQYVAYDQVTQSLVLVYSNGNIDLYKNGTFHNIADLKLWSTPQDKHVYHIYTENGLAYLSTSLGLIALDLDNAQVARTYRFSRKTEQLTIKGFTKGAGRYYLLTNAGIYDIAEGAAGFDDLASWHNIDTTTAYTRMTSVDGHIFVAAQRKIFTISAADTIQLVYKADTNILSIDPGINKLLVGMSNSGGPVVKVMDMTYSFTDSFNIEGNPAQALELADGSIWVATPAGGLEKRMPGQALEHIIPDGPSSAYSYDIYAYDRDVYVAHGLYNNSYFAGFTINGVSRYRNGAWKLYRHGLFAPFNYLHDFSALAKNERTGTLYAGSFVEGLFILDSNDAAVPVDQSVFDGSAAYGANSHDVISVALDKNDNLWVSLMFAKRQLYLKTRDNSWYAFKVPKIGYGGQLAIDDSGVVWMAGGSGDGLASLNIMNTPGDTTDDVFVKYLSGKGVGNLPANKVNCIAKDNNNDIWLGTLSGVAVIKKCPGGDVCDAELPELSYQGYTGPLFGGTDVKTIAVDAANRKWIGTTEGAWLLSPGGTQVLQHFTKDNSPLPTNLVRKITIDHATGDVYIGTDNGLVSYRSTATEASADNNDVMIFPNPVNAGYTGTIAIKGLVAGADVRITDISGQLVYKTTALGGEAVWNGRDYTGRRPQTGVYLVFVSSRDGRHTFTGKIAFIQ